jgi:hypothetical protein
MRDAIAETVLQPSLHTLEEYAELVVEECETRGIDMTDVREALESDGLSDDMWELQAAQDRLYEAGYLTVEEEDTFLIYERGARWDESCVPSGYLSDAVAVID